MGGHTFDDEDQVVLQRDLLLWEVRKVGKVIDQMVASKDNIPKSDTNERGAANWYAFASGILRSELQNTIGNIQRSRVSRQDAQS